MWPVNANIQGYMQAISAIEEKGGPTAFSMVVVILKGKTGDTYSAVKKRLTCDDALGIPSQCIVFNEKNMNGRNAHSVANKIAIQMYTKVGSIPWTVNIPPKNLMVVGIDVFHEKNKPSVMAFIASMNPSLSKNYSACSLAETAGEEIGTAIYTHLTAALDRYYEENKRLPDQIFVYRDGVGEGQLQVVQDQEVKAGCLRAASWKNTENPPKITFTIVTKRIPQRFFLKQGESFVNPNAGTVVDTTVTRPEYQDFFLISQAPGQGTTSPTHYNVIFNQSGWKLSLHQKLANKLCHLYYNWQGTVKVPAPCQYAHKLAYQVGESLGGRSPHLALSSKMHFL
jgi:aubergine-like protein